MVMQMDVLIVLGSKSDLEVAKSAAEVLKEMGVDYEIKVASAHRTPDLVVEIVSKTKASIIIAIAGLSAALPGVVASHTLKPVIGVPVSGKINLDSVLSVVQMPPGIPVAAVGLDNGKNAALLACEILALQDRNLGARLKRYRQKMEQKVRLESKNIT